MLALPFKLNQDRRHHIPEQTRKVVNWREYDEGLRRRGSLTLWFSDAAIEAWEGRGSNPGNTWGRVDIARADGSTLALSAMVRV